MKSTLFLQCAAILPLFNVLFSIVFRAAYVSAATDPALINAFIGPQNQARADVQVNPPIPPLVWDETLANYAQNYANQRKGDCALKHSNGPYGENIFWGSSGTNWQPSDADTAWIKEKSFFDFGQRLCPQAIFEKCGHYSQIVWRSSVRIGCARVVCNNGGVFMTCNYDPPGNYLGRPAY